MSFPTTRSSAVVAVRSADRAERARGFDTLVAAYWRPVYKYLRLKWNCSNEDAQDFTQGFFARALEKDFFAGYDVGKGSFRTFLRTCLDGFVSNERKAARRQKRGGDVTLIPFDFDSAEGELRAHPLSDEMTVEDYFHQEWVRNLFALAVEELRAQCEKRGQLVQFQIFERYDLEPAGEVTYEALAREFGLPGTSITNYLAAMRRNFRRLLLGKLRELTADDREFRHEARVVLGIEAP